MSIRKEIKRKHARRLRRKLHIRTGIYGTGEKPRLTVTRSHKNISCQVIDDQKGVTLAFASSLEKALKATFAGSAGNVKAAAAVGALLADRAKGLGIVSMQFDRNGYKFHGRLKALVEAARKAGLKI
jgi:large subunit ribosomal protein L18